MSSYSLFRAEVVRTRDLSPHLRRVTFGGPDLAGTVSAGHDQRIKLFFPLAGQTDPVVPEGEDWYPTYRAMPEDERPPMRTFTLRELRRDACEMDVDFVLHGDTGPASSWAGRAVPGQRLAILAPTAGEEPIVGWEFQPPADTDWVLLAGDETALPAICGIVEALPAGLRAVVFVELDSLADMQPMETKADVSVTWILRGQGLCRTIAEANLPDGLPYAWVAAESSVATGLRRHLVRDRGVDKGRVYFSGYWLLGSAIE